MEVLEYAPLYATKGDLSQRTALEKRELQAIAKEIKEALAAQESEHD